MNNFLISIVIPCYNDYLYIEQAVASAINQSYPNKEIIVIDDGSDLQTKAVLKALEHKIDLLITQENYGQSTARNKGIEAAKGEYILVLDSDDFFEPTFCEKAIDLLTNENIKLVSCYAKLVHEDNSIQIYQPKGGDITNFLYSNDALGTSLFRKKHWKMCGGYDQNMRKGMEDWEFFIRLLKNGGCAHIIKEVLYTYRKRNNSTTRIANTNKYEIIKYIHLKNKDLYTDYFPLTIDNLIGKVEHQEKEAIKNLNRLEYKIGFKILQPLRFFKKIIKI